MTQKYLLTVPDITLNDDTIPDFNDIWASFTNPFTIPDTAWEDLGFPFPPTFAVPQIPDLPSFPSDYNFHFPTMSLPSMSALYGASSVVLGQISTIVKFILDKLKAFGQLFPATGILPISLPDWPGFSGSPGFDLDDLMEPNPLAFLDHIRMPDFDFSLIPNLPDLWPDMSMPDLSSFSSLQFAVLGYLTSLLTTITSTFNKVISYFSRLPSPISIPAFPTLPAIPTWEQILAMLPEFPTLDDLKALFSGSPGFSFPGWEDFQFDLPDPLIPDFDLPSFDLTFGWCQLLISMIGKLMNDIVSWINNIPIIKAIIGAFPKIIDMIGDIPPFADVCHESVNTGIPCY